MAQAGAGQLTFAGEEFLVNGRAEQCESLTPLLDLGKLFARHGAREEEVFGLFPQGVSPWSFLAAS